MSAFDEHYEPSLPTPPTRRAAIETDFNPSLAGVSVLVLDDEEETRQMLADMLEHHGAKVALHSSGAEALESLGREKFDVLLSDLGMEEMDGVSFIRQVRALGIQTPAIALSAYTGVEHQQNALQAGFQLHLDKPVETLYLVAAIADLAELGKRQLES